MAAASSRIDFAVTKTTPSISNNFKQPTQLFVHNNLAWKPRTCNNLSLMTSFRTYAHGSSTPSNISEKVSESIKAAEETCAENSESGECAAAWDEVEELSAAASHARNRLKTSSDPLEAYCKDNPETDECRTYED